MRAIDFVGIHKAGHIELLFEFPKALPTELNVDFYFKDVVKEKHIECPVYSVEYSITPDTLRARYLNKDDEYEGSSDYPLAVSIFTTKDGEHVVKVVAFTRDSRLVDLLLNLRAIDVAIVDNKLAINTDHLRLV